MLFARVILVSMALLLPSAAPAQTYPSRPIKVLNGFAAGGAPDTILRQIAMRLEKALSVPVVVENRPGASGTIAAGAVLRAEPDGYLLLFGVAANLALAPATMKPPPYEPVSGFTPIIEVARGPYVWLVRADSAAQTMPEFVALAKAQPGRLNYASPGEGSVHHFATEMLKNRAGIDMVHVPFGSIYPALLGGQVDGMFDSMPGPLAHLSAGKLRALAVTGPKRLSALPDVPTLDELGLNGVDVFAWWGFVGPARLPPDIVSRLNTEIRKVLENPELKASMAKLAIEASPGTPEAFGATIAQEAARWKKVVGQGH